MTTHTTNLLRKLLFFGILPSLFYFVFFCIFSYPWIIHFSDSFFADAGDGIQNAWNLWWVNKTLAAGQNPWFTQLLHFPHGTTLLIHAINFSNGLISFLLSPGLSLVEKYNIIVILAFVGTGITTFWLCYAISRSFIGSLMGGFAFTFSSYHFAHAIGHLNLITLQWIPLFILAWLSFLQKPNYLRASLTVVTLALVVLTDYYYFLFCLMAAAIMLIYFIANKQIALTDPAFWKPAALAVALAIPFVLPLPLAVLVSVARDPPAGVHDPKDFSLDLFLPFIPNEIWRFATLTKWYWSKVHLSIVEGSVNLSILLLGAIGIATVNYKRLPKNATLWLWLILIFFVLSIGPRIHIVGNMIEGFKMPYTLVAFLLPPIRLGGTPIRMMVMVILAAAVLFAILISKLRCSKPVYATTFIGMTALLIVECWPGQLPLTPAVVPEYVMKLAELPSGGVIDHRNFGTAAEAYQIVHQKPLVEGSLSRIPRSVAAKDNEIMNLFSEQRYQELFTRYGIHYIIDPPNTNRAGLQPIFADNEAIIYELNR